MIFIEFRSFQSTPNYRYFWESIFIALAMNYGVNEKSLNLLSVQLIIKSEYLKNGLRGLSTRPLYNSVLSE